MTSALATQPRQATADVATQPKLAISARDLELLVWVSEQYAIRVDQLAVLLDRDLRTAQRATRRLRHARLVRARQLLIDQPTWIWLTPAGQKAAATGNAPWRPAVGMLAHIAAVNTVRLHTHSVAPEAHWVSERALARDLRRGEHLPDALLVHHEETSAVEVELQPKSRERTTRILDELTDTHNNVIYYATPAVRRALETLDATRCWPTLTIRDLPAMNGGQP